MKFDPIRRAKEIERVVMKGNRRRYYRFRYSKHYGGIVTADTVGCNLLCAYCWNYYKNLKPKGELYSAEDVAERLMRISKAKKCNFFRISGAEPILSIRSAKHLAEVISLTEGRFILETNGIMLGYIEDIVSYLKGLDVLVRVSIKGWDEESFERITGAKGRFFEYQMKALRNLEKYGMNFWIAVMFDVFGEEGVAKLKERLDVSCRMEFEFLERYPFVMENLRKRGITLI